MRSSDAVQCRQFVRAEKYGCPSVARNDCYTRPGTIQMEPSGLEQVQQSRTFFSPSASAAPGAALEPDSGMVDPELSAVVEAWPTLPVAIRADILAVVRAAK